MNSYQDSICDVCVYYYVSIPYLRYPVLHLIPITEFFRPGTAKFNPQNINPYLCTHLIYAFGGLDRENGLKPYDKYQDIEQGKTNPKYLLHALIMFSESSSAITI